jgi:P27 family predicted phage terminase small subunit
MLWQVVSMGRPAKTLAAHHADGTYREDRHGNLSLPVEVPQPSGVLSVRAAQIYTELATQLYDLGVVSSLDSLALTETASCAAELELCRDQIGGDGILIDGKEHPACGVANRLRGTLYRYLCQLGLTPRSRTGLRVEKAEADDPLDMV